MKEEEEEEEEERGENTHGAVIPQKNSLQASRRTQDEGELTGFPMAATSES